MERVDAVVLVLNAYMTTLINSYGEFIVKTVEFKILVVFVYLFSIIFKGRFVVDVLRRSRNSSQ